MDKQIFTFLICSCLIWGSCKSNTSSDDPDSIGQIIKKQQIENIVSTLSDNSMMGRRSFSEGSRKAADYIADKFEEIGLVPIKNESNYLQEFSRYILRPTSSSLQINGKTVKRDSFFVDSDHESLSWNNLSSYNTVIISASDPLGNALSETGNTIVLVDLSHNESFERYQRSYGGIKTTLNTNEGASKIFVRTSITKINSGSFSYEASVEEQIGNNVVGQIPGTSSKNEEVLFGAHYDHVGYLEPVNGDSIANGADDNASGTAALIMLAKYFKQTAAPKRTLTFAAFTAEEEAFRGSQYYSQQIEPKKIRAMINMDMLGKPSKFGPNTAYLTGFEKTDMGDILKANLKGTKYNIYPDPYPDQSLFYRTDNTVFASLGIPAHSLSTLQPKKDPYYHTVDDEINTLDLDNLTNITRGIAKASKSIINGTETPSRIKTSKRPAKRE